MKQFLATIVLTLGLCFRAVAADFDHGFQINETFNEVSFLEADTPDVVVPARFEQAVFDGDSTIRWITPHSARPFFF